jgi:hypothetical protein
LAGIDQHQTRTATRAANTAHPTRASGATISTHAAIDINIVVTTPTLPATAARASSSASTTNRLNAG